VGTTTGVIAGIPVTKNTKRGLEFRNHVEGAFRDGCATAQPEEYAKPKLKWDEKSFVGELR